MRNKVTLPRLVNKYFNCLTYESDEPIYTYNDECMPYFVRKSIKGGCFAAFNQYYKSSISDEVFNNISTETKVSGNICEILVKHFEYVN